MRTALPSFQYGELKITRVADSFGYAPASGKRTSRAVRFKSAMLVYCRLARRDNSVAFIRDACQIEAIAMIHVVGEPDLAMRNVFNQRQSAVGRYDEHFSRLRKNCSKRRAEPPDS